MNKASPAMALAAVMLIGFVSAGRAEDSRKPDSHVTDSHVVAARADEERLLGRADSGDEQRDLLPFTRQIAIGGIVAGSLEASTAAAGVPAVAMLEALQAFAT